MLPDASTYTIKYNKLLSTTSAVSRTPLTTLYAFISDHSFRNKGEKNDGRKLLSKKTRERKNPFQLKNKA